MFLSTKGDVIYGVRICVFAGELGKETFHYKNSSQFKKSPKVGGR